MIEDTLQKIGLTRGEVKVYLTLLWTGQTTTGKIIKESQLSSGKIYEILDKLIKKGLVSFVIKDKTKYFEAASPKMILQYIKDKEEELKKGGQKIESILPDLIKLQKSKKEEYSTTIYRGFRGIRSAVSDILDELSSGDEILAAGIQSEKDPSQNRFWKHWHKERIRKKIKCRVIFSDRGTDYYKLFKKMKLTEVRFLPSLVFTTVDVTKNKVLIFAYKNDVSVVVIENQEIAEKFREIFNILWQIAKP